MNRGDTTNGQHVFDEEIRSFLDRESARLVAHRPADEDVVAAIRHRRDRRWPTRAGASVAAAAFVVGLVTIASGLILRPAVELGASPSPSVSEPPLNLPAVAAGQRCPASPPAAHGTALPGSLGNGPVRLAAASSAGTVFFEDWPGGAWKAIDVLWTVEPDFTGPVLVRGARLDGHGELAFGDASQPLRELRIEEPSGEILAIDGTSLLSTASVRVKSAGCYGLQIDAGGRSSTVIIEVRPIHDALDRLERPLQLPAASASACPVTSTTGAVPFMPDARGSGPLYLAGGGTLSLEGARQSGGFWFLKDAWVADPRERGPILVRGGRIDAPGDLRFGDGSEPAGEVRLPVHSAEFTSDQPPGWRLFNEYLRPPSRGCYAMQLDTLAESHWLVFEVTP
jgi:hypothetical protein